MLARLVHWYNADTGEVSHLDVLRMLWHRHRLNRTNKGTTWDKHMAAILHVLGKHPTKNAAEIQRWTAYRDECVRLAESEVK